MENTTYAQRQWQLLADEGYRFDPEIGYMSKGSSAYFVPKRERKIAQRVSEQATDASRERGLIAVVQILGA